MSQKQGKGPSRASQMRSWLAAHGPATAAQIRDGMGLTPQQLKATLFELVSKGMAVHQGEKRPRTYSAGREAREWRNHDQQALAARKAKRLAYNAERRRKNGRTMAQIQADAIQKRIDAMAAKLAADNAVRRQVKQAHDAAEKRDAARAVQAIKANAMAGAPAKHDDFPDTEAFIRANPDKLIRLPPGVWSAPLRFTY